MIRSQLFCAVVFASLLFSAGSLKIHAQELAYDTLVICPKPLLPAMRPWFEHRIRQGRKIGVISDCDDRETIREGIRTAAKSGKLTHVLIVGDDHPDRKRSDKLRAVTVPTAQVEAKINVRWGSEPIIATDNWYADIDEDHVPDVAIGRLTADTPEQLTPIIEKIIAYERSDDQSLWRRKVNFIAGVGGFGVVADSIIDMATKSLITGNIPASYCTSMTYASLNSPYCPDPRRLPETAIARHNEGCLFWVYIGHGQRRWLDSMRIGRQDFPILTVDHVDSMRCTSGSPIAVFLACYTGAFDEREDCLSEELLASKSGPVAVISGTRVTMPYANAVLAQAMLRHCFEEDHATLGEVILHAKRDAAGDGDGSRKLLDAIAAAISPNKEELEVERREHLHMYTLLGDPLLAMHKPRRIELSVAKSAAAGETIHVQGTSDLSGKATIELVCRRDKLTFDSPNRRGFRLTRETAEDLMEVYERANDQRWTSRTLDVVNGRFDTTIAVPQDCRGHCHVRVYIEGKRQFAMGAADLYVQRISNEERDPFKE